VSGSILVLIYSHLALGLPVILLAHVEGAGHVITLIGYSLRPAKVLPHEVAPGQTSIPLRGLRIDKFYGHDDQFGPFGRLAIGPSATVGPAVYPVTLKGAWIRACALQSP
jgi:hypothetical protein